jgi:hypothetical protein
MVIEPSPFSERRISPESGPASLIQVNGRVGVLRALMAASARASASARGQTRRDDLAHLVGDDAGPLEEAVARRDQTAVHGHRHDLEVQQSDKARQNRSAVRGGCSPWGTRVPSGKITRSGARCPTAADAHGVASGASPVRLHRVPQADKAVSDAPTRPHSGMSEQLRLWRLRHRARQRTGSRMSSASKIDFHA